jgi:uncharacterized damage-inducible protein DinB
MSENLSFPIGKFAPPAPFSAEQRRQFIDEIAEAPGRLRDAVAQLTPEQMDTPYRPGGWTVRQVVHHVPDSHLNAYVRFKLALTEDEPTVRPYDEKLWAKTPEVPNTPVEVSLELLESLHKRWVTLLLGMTAEDFARKMKHPELGVVNLSWYLALYAWHGKHHVAHVTSLRNRLGWGYHL